MCGTNGATFFSRRYISQNCGFQLRRQYRFSVLCGAPDAVAKVLLEIALAGFGIKDTVAQSPLNIGDRADVAGDEVGQLIS